MLPALGSLEVNRTQGLPHARQFLNQLSSVPRPKSLALVNQLALGAILLTVTPLRGILFLKPTLVPRQEGSIVANKIRWDWCSLTGNRHRCSSIIYQRKNIHPSTPSRAMSLIYQKIEKKKERRKKGAGRQWSAHFTHRA